MNTHLKFKIVTIFVITCLLFSIKVNAQAQVNADLELKIAYPHNNQVIPFGDSVRTSFFIINHGSDDIIDDTLMVRTDNPMIGGGFVGDIPVGDTGIAHIGLQWKDEGDTNNDTLSLCYYFRNPVSISNRVADTNAANDTTCFSYVMLGDPNTGIETSQTSHPIKLFPNPASNLVTIQLNSARYHKLQICITDVFGREVFSHDYSTQSKSNDNGIHFNVSGFQAGIYFIRMLADDQTFMSKLIVR